MIACVERADSLRQSIDAIIQSCEGIDAELIVVSALPEASIAAARDAYPHVAFVHLPEDTLVPRLWSEGIALSSGSIVALTISQCLATKKWAPSLLSALAQGAAAAGGPISLHPGASTTDAAIFFLRYSAFLSAESHPTTAGIAGDNAAYSRASLEIGGWDRETGFWEIEVNERLTNAGFRIDFDPGAEMVFAKTGNALATAGRRYEHGRRFGVTRALDNGEAPLRIVLASPLVPFVLFARAARRAWPVKRYRAKLFIALPIFAFLSASWAAGEAIGAMEAAVAHRS